MWGSHFAPGVSCPRCRAKWSFYEHHPPRSDLLAGFLGSWVGSHRGASCLIQLQYHGPPRGTQTGAISVHPETSCARCEGEQLTPSRSHHGHQHTGATMGVPPRAFSTAEPLPCKNVYSYRIRV